MLPKRRRQGILAISVLTVLLAVGCSAPSSPGDATTPADNPSSSEASPTPMPESSEGGSAAVSLGMPFDEAMAATGAEPVADACPWVALASNDGYVATIQRDADGDAGSPVILVSAWAQAEASGRVGPRTPEGIGVGSTVTEAWAAYPDAVELAPDGMGDRRYLQVDTEGDGDVFLAFTEGEERVWELVVTTLSVPPYEPCA